MEWAETAERKSSHDFLRQEGHKFLHFSEPENGLILASPGAPGSPLVRCRSSDFEVFWGVLRCFEVSYGVVEVFWGVSEKFPKNPFLGQIRGYFWPAGIFPGIRYWKSIILLLCLRLWLSQYYWNLSTFPLSRRHPFRRIRYWKSIILLCLGGTLAQSAEFDIIENLSFSRHPLAQPVYYWKSINLLLCLEGILWLSGGEMVVLFVLSLFFFFPFSRAPLLSPFFLFLFSGIVSSFFLGVFS